MTANGIFFAVDYNEFAIVREDSHQIRGKLIQSSASAEKWPPYFVAFMATNRIPWSVTLCTDGQMIQCLITKCPYRSKRKNNALTIKPLVQVLAWRWNALREHEIVHNELVCKYGETKKICEWNNEDVKVILRWLKQRSSLDENPCPPMTDVLGDQFHINVGSQQFVVSASHLMRISPVFSAMLSVNMKENASREATLDGDIEPEEFRAFLEQISWTEQMIWPNPITVRGLLKLAERFQVDKLMDRCAHHLKNCVEIPLIERLLLSATYRLFTFEITSILVPNAELNDLYHENIAILRSGNVSNVLMNLLIMHLASLDREGEWL